MSVPDLRRLWSAETVTRVGDAVTNLALPLTAVATLNASAGDMGLLGGVQFGALLVLGIPVGVWVDRRRSRRGLVVASDLGRALIIASVPIAHLLGWLSFTNLVLAAALSTALGSMGDAAIASYVPLLAGRTRLQSMNAMLELSRSASLVAGPTLTAGLIALVGPPGSLTVDAVSFVGSALILARVKDVGVVLKPNNLHRSPLGEVTEGLRFLMGQPLVRATALTAAINNFARSAGHTVLLLFLVNEAGASPAATSLTFAIGNIGFAVGALIAARMTRLLGLGRAMIAAVSLFGPGMAIVAAAPTSKALAATTVMLFMNGIGIAMHNVNQVSVRQAVTPDALRARVVSASRVLILGAVPIGAAVGGVLGEMVGLRDTLWWATIGLLAGTLPYLLGSIRRLKTIDDVDDPGETRHEVLP